MAMRLVGLVRPAMSAASAVGGTAEGLGNGRAGQEVDPSCGRRRRKRKGGGSHGAGLSPTRSPQPGLASSLRTVSSRHVP